MKIAVIIFAPLNLHTNLELILERANEKIWPEAEKNFYFFVTEMRQNISSKMLERGISAEGFQIPSRGYPLTFLYKFFDASGLIKELSAQDFDQIFWIDGNVLPNGRLGEETKVSGIALVRDPEFPDISPVPIPVPEESSAFAEVSLTFSPRLLWWAPGAIDGLLENLVSLITQDDLNQTSVNDLCPYFNKGITFLDPNSITIFGPSYLVPSDITIKELSKIWKEKVIRKFSYLNLEEKYYFPHKRVITHSLEGHDLGNKLFQVSTVLATAWDQKLVPVFPLEDTDFRASIFRNLPRFDIVNRKFQAYAPDNFSYEPIPPLPGNKGIILVGAYQSFKYFEKYRDEIMKLLLPPSYLSYSKNIMNSINPEGLTTISVHFRLPAEDWFINLDKLWYQYAIRQITQEEGEKYIFLVFTDEISIPVDIFPPNSRIINCSDFIYSGFDCEVIDLILASMADHHILSNSSWAAWSAFLGDQGKSRVIAPKEWFGVRAREKNFTPQDIYLPHWELI